jgi:hypothetical protein
MTVVYAIEDIFTCDACGASQVEEVLIEAIVVTEVVKINEFGSLGYATQDVQSGNVDRLRCVGCGKIVGRDDLWAMLPSQADKKDCAGG